MSRFFFDQLPEKKLQTSKFLSQNKMSQKKASRKLGTADMPLKLTVQTETRKSEVETLVAENAFIATINVDPDKEENISDLLGLM